MHEGFGPFHLRLVFPPTVYGQCTHSKRHLQLRLRLNIFRNDERLNVMRRRDWTKHRRSFWKLIYTKGREWRTKYRNYDAETFVSINLKSSFIMGTFVADA